MLWILASDSVTYPLWSLPIELSPEVEDITEYHGIDVPLTDGYKSSLKVGFDAGIKSWRLTFPAVSSLDVRADTIQDVNGEQVSREQYIRSMFVWNKSSLTPFVYLWRNTYYFVDFADNVLSMQRMKIKIYTTGITLRQRRMKGVTLPAPA